MSIRSVVHSLIHFSIGNGLNTYLWFDYWLPMGPIHSVFGDGAILASGLGRNARVASIISNGDWQWPLVPEQIVPHPELDDMIIWGAHREATFL